MNKSLGIGVIRKYVFLVALCFFTLFSSFTAPVLFGEIIERIEPLTQTVYITKTGKKYHKGINNSKIEIKKSKAVEIGYDACKVCKP